MSLNRNLWKSSEKASPDTGISSNHDLEIDYRILPDDQLITRCIQNERGAWDEFFRRFIPDIIKGIKRGLKNGGRSDLCNDSDVIWDIHKNIVKKLYSEGKINQNLDASRVRHWLFSIGLNQARDWLKKSRQTKRLPEVDTQRGMRLFSDPLPEKENLTLGETIRQTDFINEELGQHVEGVIEKFNDIENEKLFWALRLKVLAYLPITKSELQDLARYTGYSLKELRKFISKLEKKLEEKEKEKIQSLARAVTLWHEIRHLEAELSEKIKGSLTLENEKEIEKLIKKIEKKENRRQIYLKQEQKLTTPSNADIGKMLGIPADKVGQISKIVARARELLKSKL